MSQRQKHVFETTLAGRPLIVETGFMAQQANGSVLVRYGDTVVLSVAVASEKPSDLPFFPLTVNYEEKMYAVGKIPGGFIKREGRPSEAATLTARLIDRPIRPMFPEGVRNEIQITNTVLSVEHDNTPDIVAMFGSSLALAISDIPFDGPIAGVHIGRVDGELVINPTVEQAEKSDIDLTVAGTKEAINMVESSAQEVAENDMLEAILYGHEQVVELVRFQNEIVAEIGKEKFEFELSLPAQDIVDQVNEVYLDQMSEAIQTYDKQERVHAIDEVKEQALLVFEETYQDNPELEDILADAKQALNDLEQAEVRRLITEENIRPDGRKADEIRPLSSKVDVLPRVHGSGLFTRGQTQVLSSATLAPLSEHQIIDGLGVEEGKRFIHHYNFPPYSVGETGRMGGPGRREIGHGALGEKALKRVIPSEEEFPYTIRLVAEVLESNGSSSMASVCAGTLAMMDAGIPIKAPVAGIAMGLVMEGDKYNILTDIQGLEDALGDMDFKVAGTKDGITALQMDIKIQGISREILEEALDRAKVARLTILDNMLGALSQPRAELSQYAPKIETIQISPDKIGTVIGRGGETIDSIIEETGVKIDISEEGMVSVASSDADMIKRAIEIIEGLTHEVEVGNIYEEAVVKRIENYGAFVEVAPGQDGLLHISELDTGYVKNVSDVLSVGDKIKVEVIEIDDRGRINLSRKSLMEQE